jgi:hypothetical protein
VQSLSADLQLHALQARQGLLLEVHSRQMEAFARRSLSRNSSLTSQQAYNYSDSTVMLNEALALWPLRSSAARSMTLDIALLAPGAAAPLGEVSKEVRSLEEPSSKTYEIRLVSGAVLAVRIAVHPLAAPSSGAGCAPYTRAASSAAKCLLTLTLIQRALLSST